MVYPGPMNMAQLTGLRSPNVIQLGNINGVPVQIQSAATNQQVIQGATLQALGLQAGSLSPLQTIQLTGGGGQQIVGKFSQRANSRLSFCLLLYVSLTTSCCLAVDSPTAPARSKRPDPVASCERSDSSNDNPASSTAGGHTDSYGSGDSDSNGGRHYDK